LRNVGTYRPRALRHQLGRLFHFASAQNIIPTEISDAVLATFHQALENESIVPDPYEIWRGAAKSWNNAAERIPGWPQARLTVPSRTRSFSMPWIDFPPTLVADVESYLRRAAGLDLSDDMSCDDRKATQAIAAVGDGDNKEWHRRDLWAGDGARLLATW
jgi:hypothetical protein